jgi:alanyl-tRNA synthetase
MKTALNYLKDSYNFTDKAIVLTANKDTIGNYILLNQTIFYPQGGGQPSDTGYFQIDDLIIKVNSVKMFDGEVRHYIDQNYRDIINKEVTLTIEQSKRLLHAKLHTAGHLISNIIEKHYPNCQAVKGHHYPDVAYVEFKVKGNAQFSIDNINDFINEAINSDFYLEHKEVESSKLPEVCPNLSFTVPTNKSLRIVRIGEFPFSPCGGTHVKSTKSLAGLKIVKIKSKDTLARITYEIE